MVLNRQLWSPDTCGCIIEELWNSDNPQTLHTLGEFVYRCEEHQHGNYDIILKENQTKNLVLKHIIENDALPLHMIDKQTSLEFETRQKQVTKNLHNNIVYNYYFDKDRKFIFSFEGIDKNGDIVTLSNQDKVSIHNILNKHIGEGKHQMVDVLHPNLHPEYRASLDNRQSTNIHKLKAENKFREQRKREQSLQQKQNKIKEFFTK